MVYRFATTFLPAALVASELLAASPVPDPNGRIAGEIAGRTFDLPVLCREDGPLFEMPSHQDLFWSTNAENVAVDAVKAFTMGPMFGVTAYLGDERYEFGAMGVKIEGFPFEYTGDIRSEKHGNYSVSLTIDCPN